MANILVVENNRCIVDLLEEILVSGGHQVSTTQSGVQASQLFKKRLFDMAFIDLGLPDIDGLTLIRELKNSNNPTVPVVISGRSDIDAAVESFRAGARDYILKPFDVDDILRVAKEIPCDQNKVKRNDISLHKANSGVGNGFVTLLVNQIIDPILVGVTFFISMIMQNAILPYQAPITLILIKKYMFLSICLGFCWGFIARYFHYRTETIYWTQLKNYAFSLGSAYLLFGTILFFVFPMADCRPAMIFSFIIASALLTINRQYIIPRLSALAKSRKEGKRRIIIVGKGPRADSMLGNLQKHFGANQVKRITPDATINEKKTKKRLSESNGELYLDGGSLGHDEINHLIKDFGGDRVIINIQDITSEDEKKLARV
jgi:CheY-like chemotaxis protein